jgi:hypothetical protein
MTALAMVHAKMIWPPFRSVVTLPSTSNRPAEWGLSHA